MSTDEYKGCTRVNFLPSTEYQDCVVPSPSIVLLTNPTAWELLFYTIIF